MRKALCGLAVAVVICAGIGGINYIIRRNAERQSIVAALQSRAEAVAAVQVKPGPAGRGARRGGNPDVLPASALAKSLRAVDVSACPEPFLVAWRSYVSAWERRDAERTEKNLKLATRGVGALLQGADLGQGELPEWTNLLRVAHSYGISDD